MVQNWLLLFGTPHEFPWSTSRSAEIESRRAQMTDVLIFDVLLIRGGIRQPDMLYPPTDLHSLRRLLEVINGSSYDSLKKDCLVYILLKWFQDGREAAYAEEKCIPSQFVSLADAYWHLDTGIHVEVCRHIWYHGFVEPYDVWYRKQFQYCQMQGSTGTTPQKSCRRFRCPRIRPHSS